MKTDNTDVGEEEIGEDSEESQEKKKKKKKSGKEIVDVQSLRLEVKKENPEIIDLSADALSSKDVGFLPTGIPELDAQLGGGFPLGRLTEIFGWEGCGKTALWELAVIDVVRRDGFALVIEPERAYEQNRIRQKLLKLPRIIDMLPDKKEMTVDEWWDKKMEDPLYFDPCDLILWSHPETMEEAVREMESALENIARMKSVDFPCIIVIDSIATLSTVSEMEHDVGDQQYSSHAIILSRSLRKNVNSLMSKTKTSVIFINQCRTKMGRAFGDDPYETFGGKSVRFYASIRIKVSNIGKFSLKDGENKLKKGASAPPLGQWSEVFLIKSKIWGVQPWTKSKFLIMYDGGVSSEWGIYEYLKSNKILKSAGSNGTTIDGVEGNFSKSSWVDFYKANREAIESIIYDEAEIVATPE